MMYRMTRTVVVSTLAAVMFTGIALTGCSTSVANVEPNLGKLHALLEKRTEGSYVEACSYFDKLDTRTKNTLTPQMLKDVNPLVVYMGASRLVKEKMYDEAAPVMADLIVNGTDEGELHQRMEHEWHTDRKATTWPIMMSKVGRILTMNMENYQQEPRKRAEHFLVTMLQLETNKPFSKEDAAARLMKLSREAASGNS